jgi:2-dehydropantoate 2-reductase
LQNGVDAVPQLTAELGPDAVIGGLCKIVSFVVAPGHIRHAGFEPSVIFGELNNRRTDRVERIHEAFTRAGIKAAITPDIHVALWTKFLFIAAFSGVGALRQTSASAFRSDPESRSLLLQAMKEIYDLAHARHVRLPEDSIEQAIASVDSLPQEATSSMQRDIAAGKPSELESQNGAVIRMARESLIQVPTHELIYESLKPLEMKARRKLELQATDGSLAI